MRRDTGKTTGFVGYGPSITGRGPAVREAKNMRVVINLECSECKRRNYATTKNKRTHTARLELRKYCKWCGRHTVHRETR